MEVCAPPPLACARGPSPGRTRCVCTRLPLRAAARGRCAGHAALFGSGKRRCARPVQPGAPGPWRAAHLREEVGGEAHPPVLRPARESRLPARQRGVQRAGAARGGGRGRQRDVPPQQAGARDCRNRRRRMAAAARQARCSRGARRGRGHARVSSGGRERQPTVSVAFSLHQALFTIFCESFIFYLLFFLVRLKGLVYSTASTLYKRVT